MPRHPPAHRREVLRRLKGGEHPIALAQEAASISDGGHAASALLALAGDRRMPEEKAGELVDEARRRLGEVDRPGRFAEAWGEAVSLLAKVPDTRAVAARKRGLHDAAVAAVEAMPDGRWTADAIAAIAPGTPPALRPRLLRRALRNKGLEAESARPVLEGTPGAVGIVQDEASAEVASRLLGGIDVLEQALASAWAIEDDAARREALRVLVWRLEDRNDLDTIVAGAKGKADAAYVLTTVAARADRLGLDPAKDFARAGKALEELQGAARAKAHRRLSQAMERAGLPPLPPESEAAQQAVDAAPDAGDAAPPSGEAGPAGDASGETTNEDPAAQVPVRPGERHVLALVEAYQGGLGPAHLRAVARAAPLCHAFGLDLCLMGFPSDDAEALVDLVDAESSIGEGAGYARSLLEAGRLRVIPVDGGLPAAWPGTPVASTPHPDAGKAAGLDVGGPVCLLVGLGRQGLPKRILDAVEHHHELTGQGVSLETATALGILADRLGRVPL